MCLGQFVPNLCAWVKEVVISRNVLSRPVLVVWKPSVPEVEVDNVDGKPEVNNELDWGLMDETEEYEAY